MKIKGIAQVLMAVSLAAGTVEVHAQAAPHQSGTVKAASADGLTLTTAAGQDYTVTLPATTKVLVVPPGAAPTAATSGTAADVAVGDKAIVIGTASDTGTKLTATKVYLMKSAAIAQSHAADQAAWAQGIGGIVKSVDTTSGKIVLASGMKTITVTTTPATVERHYSGTSVNFADAVKCSLADVKVGDQLRVRGTKSADGLSLAADELVAGTFHNYSGLISSVDAAAGTVTLKDLTTKKTVTVAVTSNSDVKRIPPQMATMLAARMKGTAGGGAVAAGGAAGGGGGGARGGGAGGAPGGGGGYGGARAGADLSQMLARFPAETLAGLKVGEAVMIVASSPASDPSKSTAVTLLAGVDAILTASPSGDMTLSPWSVGGAPDMGGMGGGGGK